MPKNKASQKPENRITQLVNKPWFPGLFVKSSVAVLTLTTILWSTLSAKIQQSNADQLVNAYLFDHLDTFRGALLPAQHTFLLKWPLFLFIKLFGYSADTFLIFTVGITLLTVLILARIMYQIESRPFIFGALCLALASVLLLIPAQPYPGGILPVNMAMITTRNLEYIVYIAALVLLVRSRHVKSRSFWLAVFLLTLLGASDKLFLIMTAGGAAIALLVYALARGWRLVSMTAQWLLAGILSTAAALGLLWALDKLGVLHIVGQTATSPYASIHSMQALKQGIKYATTGLLTNFGANPLFGEATVRSLPHQLIKLFFSPSSLGYIVNLAIMCVGIVAVWQIFRRSLKHNKDDRIHLDTPAKVSLMLVWTTLAATASFLLTDHYYLVDARYLTIVLFAAFISMATITRNRQWQPRTVAVVAGIICLGMITGVATTISIYNRENRALADMTTRNEFVAQALRQLHTDTLVGDYWRVIPINLLANSSLHVTPLADCLQPREVLSSQAWQPDLAHHGFAYLLTMDRSLTGNPGCTIDQILAKYGRPNRSVLVAGTLDKPQELLMFYDKGTNMSAPAVISSKPVTTVAPITPDELPNTACATPTVMNIVAHEDDDLLFMNPDVMRDISAGKCVRTVYVTAGDAGAGRLYWLGRESGSEAAYDIMDGPGRDIWVERTVKIADRQYVTVANPRGNSKISLIFMHLPDGKIDGTGFAPSQHQSLERLESGKVKTIDTVDGQSTYSSDKLTVALGSLLATYQPSEIHTQSNITFGKYRDHSDHMAVGRLVKRAYDQYENQRYENKTIIPIKFYIGYPVRSMPENVFGNDLAYKEAVFFSYSEFDAGVCKSDKICQKQSYGAYLRHQVISPY